MRIKFLLFFALSLAAPLVFAAAQESHVAINEAIKAFVTAETRALPGKVTIKINDIDQHVTRPACPRLEVFLPAGSRLFGNSTVGVRCTGKEEWTLFVPVAIRVAADQLIVNKPLKQGDSIRAEDISIQNGELTESDILTDPAQAVGKIAKIGIGAGQVLKRDMLRAPYVILQGQNVQLVAGGQGFSVRTEGQALNNAAKGESVQVKTESGQRITGVAGADGSVFVK